MSLLRSRKHYCTDTKGYRVDYKKILRKLRKEARGEIDYEELQQRLDKVQEYRLTRSIDRNKQALQQKQSEKESPTKVPAPIQEEKKTSWWQGIYRLFSNDK